MTTKPIALVTGGAQGIGLACAEALAEDGYRIVLADINEEGVTAAAADLGGDTLGLACDMGDPAAVAAMFDKVESDVGPASVLVNNAGVAMPGDFLDYDLETFNRVIAINLNGIFAPFLLAQEVYIPDPWLKRAVERIIGACSWRTCYHGMARGVSYDWKGISDGGRDHF